MTEQHNIPSGYSTSQAAKLLDVSQHEVARLVRAGALNACKIDAGPYVIDAESVQRRMSSTVSKGRPWDAETAWAALLMLDGIDIPNIGYHKRRRLRLKLADISAEELIALSRKRMRASAYRCSPSFTDEVRREISLSGGASPWVNAMGLATPVADTIDGYALRPEAEIARDFFLLADTTGTCILRTAYDLPEPLRTLRVMPPIIVAADLALSTDARERRCGLDFLEEKLNEHRAS